MGWVQKGKFTSADGVILFNVSRRAFTCSYIFIFVVCLCNSSISRFRPLTHRGWRITTARHLAKIGSAPGIISARSLSRASGPLCTSRSLVGRRTRYKTLPHATTGYVLFVLGLNASFFHTYRKPVYILGCSLLPDKLSAGPVIPQ